MTIRIATTTSPGTSQRCFPRSPFRMFEDLFNDWAWRNAEAEPRGGWRPAADVFEKDGALHLRLELPGVDEKDVQLKIEGNILSVSGAKKHPEATEASDFRQVESLYGDFSRSFVLPESVDPDRVSAKFRNGILTVTLPQKAESKPRTIKIQ